MSLVEFGIHERANGRLVFRDGVREYVLHAVETLIPTTEQPRTWVHDRWINYEGNDEKVKNEILGCIGEDNRYIDWWQSDGATRFEGPQVWWNFSRDRAFFGMYQTRSIRAHFVDPNDCM